MITLNLKSSNYIIHKHQLESNTKLLLTCLVASELECIYIHKLKFCLQLGTNASVSPNKYMRQSMGKDSTSTQKYESCLCNHF